MHIKKIIILGGGGHAKVIAGALLQMPEYEVVGFLDDDVTKTDMLGIKNIGKLTPANQSLETKNVVLGIGHVGNTTFPKKLVAMYEESGFLFETIVAPGARVSPFATIGKGAVIAEGAIIQPLASIGNYSIVNTNASVDHDCIIGNYCHIAPGSSLSGGITIGDECLLGTGSSIIQGVEISSNCVIGAGSVVITNCLEPGTYVGVPARKIK